MKKRNGFVSNSSSTSFCIYGASVEDELDAKLPEGFGYWYGDPNYSPRQIYIGREWSSIKDDETGKQFKDNVKETLKKLLGKDIKCRIIEEGYFDG